MSRITRITTTIAPTIPPATAAIEEPANKTKLMVTGFVLFSSYLEVQVGIVVHRMSR